VVVDFRGAPPQDIGLARLATVECVDKKVDVQLHLLDIGTARRIRSFLFG
jgi:hypothetical protein